MMKPEQQLANDFNKMKKKLDLVKHEWQSFISTGRLLSENVISAEVLSSWTRCRNRGLDPYGAPGGVLSEQMLAERIEQNRKLFEVATPFLQTIAENVEGTGFRVDLFDKDLYLLWCYGDQEVLKDSRQKSLARPGTNRSEITSGTNAINLAALLERPVQLIGAEHYKEALQHWTCSAVPIKDEDGKVIAVINAAGYYWLSHQHTLAMVTALGKSIEYNLLQRASRRELEKTNNFNKEIIESISDSLIVVNTDGRITMANKVAKKVMSIDGQDVTGYTAEGLWGCDNPFSAVLKTKQPIVDGEVSFVRGEKVIRLIGTIRPINRNEQELQGVIGTFKEISHTRGMIRNYVGWKAHFCFEDLLGESAEFRQAVRLARETAKIGSHVLIQGESGTGKELFSQAIHQASDNSDGPFVVVNCAAIPSGLLESELFGYEGGAFTGAKKNGQPGKFELADGGSIFLDEINSLPLEMQAKLLRALQNKTVVRVGGSEEIPITAKVIAASNTDLWQMVKRGEFREDLFYRVNVITINIPPLRQRGNDIELLIENIVAKKTLLPKFTLAESALALMKRYEWPGNIRELENVLERGAVLAKARGSQRVEAEDIASYPGMNRSAAGKSSEPFPRIGAAELKTVEKEAIQVALSLYKGNISAAAQHLGVARNTLYRKMKRFGIDYQD